MNAKVTVVLLLWSCLALVAAAGSSGLERNASFFYESSGERLPEGECEFVTRICLEHFVQYDDFYSCV